MPVTINIPSIEDVVSKLAAGSISGVDIHIMLNESVKMLDRNIRSFVRTVEPETGWESRPFLHNFPVSIKDIIDTKGIVTEYGSQIFSGHVPARDAAVVNRLKLNGARIQGKTATHEFAMGIVTPQSRNPWDEDHIAGGSSGGSAAAVAAGFSLLSIGTDTAGSIRIPAAFCGVSGLKPSSGKISLRGIYPEAWSLDTVGPICRFASDIKFALSFMGYRPQASSKPVERNASIITELVENSDISVRKIFNKFTETLSSEEILDVGEISIPEINDMAHKDDLMDSSENFTIQKDLFSRFPEKFSPLSAEQLRYGSTVRAHEYLEAWRTRARFTRKMREIFRSRGILLLPSAPTIAPLFADIKDKPSSYFMNYMRYTNIFNFSRDPALSIPIGFADGMPVGAQMAYSWGHDFQLCDFAAQFQNVTDYHLMFPAKFAHRAEVLADFLSR